VRPDTVLATNTSSLSVTAIAAGLALAHRTAGLHFFNPVPLMKVVEVIAGIRTTTEVCAALVACSGHIGHTPLRAADTPGFIVHHAGRGYGTEAMRLVGEGICDFGSTDQILRDQVGFKLGPVEWMDLTRLDNRSWRGSMASITTSHVIGPARSPRNASPAARSVASLANVSNAMRKERGRCQLSQCLPIPDELQPVWVSPRAARRPQLLQLPTDLGAATESTQTPSAAALILLAPLGFDVTTMAVVERLDPTRTIGIDLLVDDACTRRRVLATNPATRRDMRRAAAALMARDGKAVSVIRDSGGFVTQRVVAMIVNIACDMCQQGVCSAADLEMASQLGLAHPLEPLETGSTFGPPNILKVLFNMQTVSGDPRYRLGRLSGLGLEPNPQPDSLLARVAPAWRDRPEPAAR